jgi:hypothetical protein
VEHGGTIAHTRWCMHGRFLILPFLALTRARVSLPCSNFIGTLDDHEEDNPDYLLLPLSAAGVRVDHGSLLAIDDQSQKLNVQLRVRHREEWSEEEEADEYTLTGEFAPQSTGIDADEERKDAAEELASKASVILKPTTRAAEDEIEMSDTPLAATGGTSASSSAVAASSTAGVKRKHPDDAETQDGTAKKAKAATLTSGGNDESDAIELD